MANRSILRVDQQSAGTLAYREAAIVVTRLQRYQKPAYSSPLSLKLVLEGVEEYQLDGQIHRLQAGQYMVVNAGRPISVDFSATTPAVGVCIQPPPDLVEDVWSVYSGSTDLEPTACNVGQVFLERPSRAASDAFGRYFSRLSHYLVSDPGRDPCFDLQLVYLEVAEQLVQSQLQLLQKLSILPGKRSSTQRELLQRLLTARDFIEDNYDRQFSIDELSQVACLSKYYLIRSFKQLFGSSPYQYLLDLRLQKARALQQTGHYSYPQIADLVGYSDGRNLRKALQRSTK